VGHDPSFRAPADRSIRSRPRSLSAGDPIFGTPQFAVGQTLLVAVWIALDVIALRLRWDPYPFILLNLAFSTQAAYAACSGADRRDPCDDLRAAARARTDGLS
jgi:hypothetical protein